MHQNILVTFFMRVKRKIDWVWSIGAFEVLVFFGKHGKGKTDDIEISKILYCSLLICMFLLFDWNTKKYHISWRRKRKCACKKGLTMKLPKCTKTFWSLSTSGLKENLTVFRVNIFEFCLVYQSEIFWSWSPSECSLWYKLHLNEHINLSWFAVGEKFWLV